MSTDSSAQDQPAEGAPATTPAATATVTPRPDPPNPNNHVAAQDQPQKSEPTPTPPPSDPKIPPLPEPDVVTIPSYSRWFSWEGIHECEVRQLPEFFDGKSASKNPRLYKYYRNSIVTKFREKSWKKLSFTEARRTLVGDVGSIRRVFDFLDNWGLINYSPPSSTKHLLRWDDKEKDKDKVKDKDKDTKATLHPLPPGSESERLKKWCSGCKAVCTIACFVCDKYDLVLCARCYVRGNYRVGVNSTEFRRVEISEPVNTEWTDKETLLLLEAVMHFRDNWKRVAEHVSGRSEKECIARFIKLPFGEQFIEPIDQGEDDTSSCQTKDGDYTEPSAKRRQITPLADASNPIMAQAAFLSALAGIDVSEAAAQAAVATLYNMNHLPSRSSVLSLPPSNIEQEPAVASNGDSSLVTPEKVYAEAESFLKQEEDEFMKSISSIMEVQMKEVIDKVTHNEQMESQLEREWHQVNQMRHQLFLDQLTLLFNKPAAPKSVENVADENVRTQ